MRRNWGLARVTERMEKDRGMCASSARGPPYRPITRLLILEVFGNITNPSLEVIKLSLLVADNAILTRLKSTNVGIILHNYACNRQYA